MNCRRNVRNPRRRRTLHRMARASLARQSLRDANVLAARSLGALALFERHGLTLTQVVEPGVGAGRVVKEVLVAVARQDETETLVADEPLDRAVHRCHFESLLETYALVIDLRGTGMFPRSPARVEGR